jgi:uncharacterized protein YegJ (DUF2314 family)
MKQSDRDNIISVDGEDAEMLAAISQAKESIESFLQAFFNPKPNQESFLLKVAFEHQTGREHIWLADLDLNSTPPTGVVANETEIKGLEFMSRTEFSMGNITDWMYLEDGFLMGGFTTRLLQAREAKTQKKGLKRFFPWKRAT